MTTPSIGSSPRAIGASLIAADSTELAALDVSGMTLGTTVYNLATGTRFALMLSSASLSDTVVAVGGLSGVRWLDVSAPITEDQLKAKAARLIGNNTNGLAFLIHNTAFQLANAQTVQQNAGTAAAISGAYRFTTGATHGALAQGGIGHDSGSFATGFRTTQPWYVFGRFAITTTPDAQTIAQAGLGNSGGSALLAMGVNGSTSHTVFTCAGATGTPVSSDVPVDALQHLHEAWRIGGVTYYQIDGGDIFTGDTDITAAAGCFWQLTNGSTDGGQTMELVFYGGACPFL